jgi:hypothetical protein
MKKILPIVIAVLVLAACQNDIDPPPDIVYSTGTVAVSLTSGALTRAVSPATPALSAFTGIGIKFEAYAADTGGSVESTTRYGLNAGDEYDSTANDMTAQLKTGAVSFTINPAKYYEVTAYAYTTGSGAVTLAYQGAASRARLGAALSITLTPAGSGNGTLAFDLSLDDGTDVPTGTTSIKININSTDYTYNGTALSSDTLAKGQYIATITLTNSDGDTTTMSDTLFVYSGLTTTITNDTDNDDKPGYIATNAMGYGGDIGLEGTVTIDDQTNGADLSSVSYKISAYKTASCAATDNITVTHNSAGSGSFNGYAAVSGDDSFQLFVDRATFQSITPAGDGTRTVYLKVIGSDTTNYAYTTVSGAVSGIGFAGDPSVSGISITVVVKPENVSNKVNTNWAMPGKVTITLDKSTIYWASSGSALTASVAAANQVSGATYAWSVDGVVKSTAVDKTSFTINARDYSVASHSVGVKVSKTGTETKSGRAVFTVEAEESSP